MEENNERSGSIMALMGGYIIRLCEDIINDIKNGKCSEEEIFKIIVGTDPAHKGYFNPVDYLNADNASKYVGVNRKDFFFYTKKHKLKPTKVNNLPMGYYIKELDKIRTDVQSEKEGEIDFPTYLTE